MVFFFNSSIIDFHDVTVKSVGTVLEMQCFQKTYSEREHKLCTVTKLCENWVFKL